jgi:hypothetical protein
MFWQMDLSGQDRAAGDLTRYLSRDSAQLRDRRGDPMNVEDIEAFNATSEQYGHTKQVIISPEDGDRMSDEEMSLAARRNMNEFVDGRPSATYCYAIHRDTEHDHVQVAMTGEKRDLYAHKEERQQMRTHARTHFRERERQHGRARRERARQQERDRRHEQHRERDREQDREHGRSR